MPIAVGLLSLDVETRGLPPLPHHLVCVEKFTLLYLTLLQIYTHTKLSVIRTTPARQASVPGTCAR